MRIIAIVALCVVLAGCASNAPQQVAAAAPEPPPTKAYLPPRPLTVAEKKIVQAGIASSLKDPDSIQMRWTPFRASQKPDDVVNYCGTYNAKNSYGGYIGFKPFVASVVTKQSKIESVVLQNAGNYSQDIIDTAVMSVCTKDGLDPFSPGASEPAARKK